MKPRRSFRFSIRTLFLVLTVFGIWLGVQVKWIKDRRDFLRGNVRFSAPGTALAPWAIRVLGEPGYAQVWIGPYDPDVDQSQAKARKLFPEAESGAVFSEYPSGGF